MKDTQQVDEKTITASPLQARGLPSRDFAIRGVPKHITAEQLSAYLQGIGLKPRFVRIVPIVSVDCTVLLKCDYLLFGAENFPAILVCLPTILLFGAQLIRFYT
ncbi:hypothetical protein RvY_07696 [Ramazzottius varieornatus]|uniref:Uncharacterized protein n=1 Tax=Ramazzottius varieornatus TaxID=947166 RepID=A0A1D1V5S8_RAMVA|nr:hypothetical protein RvY_07696 [Ramazzottius varieornatus]